MLLTVMLTFTGWSPCINIEVFSSGQPVHPALFGAGRHKHESLAGTALTVCVELLAEVLIIVH